MFSAGFIEFAKWFHHRKQFYSERGWRNESTKKLCCQCSFTIKTLKYFEFSVFYIFNPGHNGRKNPATGSEINLAGGQRSTACNMFFKFISTLNYSHCELLWQANLEDKVARLELSLQQEKDFCSKRSWFSSVQSKMFRIDETLDLILTRPIGNH